MSLPLTCIFDEELKTDSDPFHPRTSTTLGHVRRLQPTTLENRNSSFPGCLRIENKRKTNETADILAAYT